MLEKFNERVYDEVNSKKIEVIIPANEEGKFNKIENARNAIFFAGPCPREDYEDDWRYEAVDILNTLGFDGKVLNPTNSNYPVAKTKSADKTLEKQTMWEQEAMNKSSALVFWIPRSEEHPAFTTNLELGDWWKKEGVYVGWPEDAIKMEYIEIRLKDIGVKVYHDLTKMLKDVVSDLNRKGTTYFTSDTHFSQQRTLELSKRPFYSLDNMDWSIISNWNKTVRMSDTVVHAGDLGDLDKLPEIINTLNFHTLKIILGNYERKELDKFWDKIAYCGPVLKTKFDEEKLEFHSGPKLKVEQILEMRHIEVYEDCYPFSDGDDNFVVVHEPINPALKEDYFDGKEYGVLYGHVHGRSFAKRNGIEIGTDYNKYTPLSLEEVKWLDNARRKYWDENVMTDKCLGEDFVG